MNDLNILADAQGRMMTSDAMRSLPLVSPLQKNINRHNVLCNMDEDQLRKLADDYGCADAEQRARATKDHLLGWITAHEDWGAYEKMIEKTRVKNG